METKLSWLLVAILALLGVVALLSQPACSEVVEPIADASTSSVLDFFGDDVLKAAAGTNYFTYHIGERGTWDEAYNACLDLGGELASILSRANQRVVENLLRRSAELVFENFDAVWVGGRYQEDCGVYWWRFIEGLNRVFYQIGGGKSFTYGYTNWARDQPKPADGQCVALFYRFHDQMNGDWLTKACNTRQPYICRWNECQRWTRDQPQCERQRGCFYVVGTGHCVRESDVPG